MAFDININLSNQLNGSLSSSLSLSLLFFLSFSHSFILSSCYDKPYLMQKLNLSHRFRCFRNSICWLYTRLFSCIIWTINNRVIGRFEIYTLISFVFRFVEKHLRLKQNIFYFNFFIKKTNRRQNLEKSTILKSFSLFGIRLNPPTENDQKLNGQYDYSF